MKNMHPKRFLFAISFISIATAIGIAGYLYLVNQSPVLAQTQTFHYIRSGATGDNSGLDWTNAWTDLPSTLVRGDTYYIADGNYSRHTFNTPVSGATYIYIKKATTSSHGTDTGWDNVYGDGQAVFAYSGGSTTVLWFTTDYWILDGVIGQGTGALEPYGFKIDYVYTPANGFAKMDGSAIYFVNHSNISISHVEINANNEGTSIASGDCDYVTIGIEGVNSNYISLSYLYLHDITHSMIHPVNSHDWIIENNYLTKMYGGIFYEQDGSCSHDPVKYIHHAPIGGIQNSTAFIVRYNIFKNIDGTAAIDFVNTNSSDWKIYGNVFYNDDPKYRYTNGVIAGANSVAISDLQIYNNTFSNLKYLSSGNDFAYGIIGFPNGNNNISKNNIFIAMPNTYGNGSYRFSNIIGSYNFLDKNPVISQDFSQVIDLSLLDDYFTNRAGGDFRLKQATNQGVILNDEFKYDIHSNTRGADSVWDRGAYEYIQTPPLKADFNTDGFVNNLDFTQFKNAFKSIFNSIFDLNSDNAIDVKDLGVLMSGWLP